MTEMHRLSLRMTDAQLAQIDALAAERGVTRTRAVRQLLDAGLAGRPAPRTTLPTEDDLLQILGERAKAGNTSAARSLLARLEARDPRATAIAAFTASLDEDDA